MSYDIKAKDLLIEFISTSEQSELAVVIEAWKKKNQSATVIDMMFAQRRAMKAGEKDGSYSCIIIYKK